MKPKIVTFLPGGVWFIITFILLILPGSDIPKADFFDIVYFDKWVHIGMFGLLTILWCYPFLLSGLGTKRLFLKIALGVILYGISMEFVQKYFASERSFDMYDILADSTGAILAFILMRIRLKK